MYSIIVDIRVHQNKRSLKHTIGGSGIKDMYGDIESPDSGRGIQSTSSNAIGIIGFRLERYIGAA